jgi:hypothetical protein
VKRSARIPAAKFSGITAEDVESAVARLAAGVSHPFADSIRYDLIVRGLMYPPKVVFGLAAERVMNRALAPSDFAGGLGSVCFRILESLGYAIVPKTPIEELPVEAELPEAEMLQPVPAAAQAECPLIGATQNADAPHVGKRRLSKRAKVLGDWAEASVFQFLEAEQRAGRIGELRWLAKEGITPGWDIEYRKPPDGELCRVEVKGGMADRMGAFEMTANELRAALEFGEGYMIALVTGSASATPKVFFIENVARWLHESRLTREPLAWAIRLGPTKS